MNEALELAVHHDLETLAHDVALWMTETGGGTVYANRELAAAYLIELFGAGADGVTVTDVLLGAVADFKERMKEASQ